MTMPELDDRLRDALRGAARVPDRDAETVAAAVTVKRRRRLVRRRAATGLALATVVATALVTTVVVVNDRGADDVQVATNQTAPPPSTTPPPTSTTVPPETVETAQAEVVAAAPTGYDVEPGDVTVVAPDEAVATVTDAAGTTYQGVRFDHDATGWKMAAASACRLPSADAACVSLPPDVHVSAGKIELGPQAYAGAVATAAAVTFAPQQSFVRGPLLDSNTVLWAADYERFGTSYTFPPSHLITFDPVSGAVTRQIDLQGEIMAIAADGSDLWALTHERSIDADGVEYRVKRIDASATVPDSMPLPPGSVPTGSIAAGSGTAWVPLRDGVLGFSAGKATPTATIDLDEQARRGIVVVGEVVYTTDGSTIRRIDPGTGTPADPLQTRATAPLTDLVARGDAVVALAGDGQLLWLDRGVTRVEAVGALPPGMTEAELHAAGDRVWATGKADLASNVDPATQSVAIEPVAVLIDDSGISATLVLAGGTDADLAVRANGELVITSGGTAYRVALPE
jgi:hypothetical protein